ncbi:hypothetical protein Tco_1031068 [Tanacetum coccineum]|uniref:Reverse transcriptase zinc-binding domain-containing protein n=1 Tax=Tanacetum coccineum TaxID=301880 RepID=A0ABQ5GA90_9ASTR
MSNLINDAQVDDFPQIMVSQDGDDMMDEEEQSRLVGKQIGRQILDGVLIANEGICMASIEDLKLLLFKVYLEKTFDIINCFSIKCDGANGVQNLMEEMDPLLRDLNELSSLSDLIGNTSLSLDDIDKWSWSYKASSTFRVKTLSNSIQNALLSYCDIGKHHIWNSWIPRKVEVCIWRVSLDRLASRLNLVARGISLIPHAHSAIILLKTCNHSFKKRSLRRLGSKAQALEIFSDRGFAHAQGSQKMQRLGI